MNSLCEIVGNYGIVLGVRHRVRHIDMTIVYHAVFRLGIWVRLGNFAPSL